MTSLHHIFLFLLHLILPPFQGGPCFVGSFQGLKPQAQSFYPFGVENGSKVETEPFNLLGAVSHKTRRLPSAQIFAFIRVHSWFLLKLECRPSSCS